MMRTLRSRQGGWAGMLVLLLAVLIVAWLSKDALKAYLGSAVTAGESAKTIKAATPGERARSFGAVDASGDAAGGSAPVPTAPMERAKGVEEFLKEQESKRGGNN